jgi:hypothetical protein
VATRHDKRGYVYLDIVTAFALLGAQRWLADRPKHESL